MLGEYRKLPVVIEALPLLWSTWSEMADFAGVGWLGEGKPGGRVDNEHLSLDIPTLEGLVHASEGDMIIKGVNGELYPCKPDIFAKTYESV